ncbi:MAG: ABC transporter ATP-binding protein [Desulfobacterales bacterium]|nr:MAG: ABC transporter ATP-binding protein [Desulfobacterales bacterium]
MLKETGSLPPVLEIADLKVFFYTDYGVVKAVDGVRFHLNAGETLGLVGESGCGKSVTAMAVLGLVRYPGRIVAGEIIYHQNAKKVRLSGLDPKGREIRSIRGNDIAMIFQEPMTSLNPVFTVGYQIMEAIILHQRLNRRQAREAAISMLAKVGIPLPEQRVDEYPHQLSGGMRQRAMIAMALSCRPSILIADEPTTALDVTIQAQVLELMMNLKAEFQTSIIMITHDLGVIAGIADRVVVMYLGKVVEEAGVREIFYNTKHPYTQGLMNSVPSVRGKIRDLKPIPGVVPDAFALPTGCSFQPRCSQVSKMCRTEAPPLTEVGPNHWVACWLHS